MTRPFAAATALAAAVGLCAPAAAQTNYTGNLGTLSGSGNNFSWSTASLWSPQGVPGGNALDTAAVSYVGSPGFPTVNFDIGQTRTLASLSLSHGGNGGTFNVNGPGGAQFNASTLTVTSSGLIASAATVFNVAVDFGSAPGRLVDSVYANTASLTFNKDVTGTGGLLIDGTAGGQPIIFANNSFKVGGAIETRSSRLTFSGLGGQTATLDSLVVSNSTGIGTGIYAGRQDGSGVYTVAVTGKTEMRSAYLELGSNSGSAATRFVLNGELQLNTANAANGLRLVIGQGATASNTVIRGGLTGNQTLHVEGTGTLTVDTTGSARSGTLATTRIQGGTVIVGVANGLSIDGAVDIRSGGARGSAAPSFSYLDAGFHSGRGWETLVRADAAGALGSGLVTVGPYATLDIAAAQGGSFPKVDVASFGVLTGDLSGATFVTTAPASAGQVRLADNAVLNVTIAPGPVGLRQRAVLPTADGPERDPVGRLGQHALQGLRVRQHRRDSGDRHPHDARGLAHGQRLHRHAGLLGRRQRPEHPRRGLQHAVPGLGRRRIGDVRRTVGQGERHRPR
jgi:hypothetical protein